LPRNPLSGAFFFHAKDTAAPGSEETPAKFTVESLKARRFKVSEPYGDGFIIGMGKVHKRGKPTT
jgi:hypothetical protein